MKKSLLLLLFVAISIVIPVLPAGAADGEKTACGSHLVFHIQPSYEAVLVSLDNIETVVMVNQVINPPGLIYECQCDMENCWEYDTGVPNPDGNVYSAPAAGCTWQDIDSCECTQPKSVCCGDVC